MLASIRATNWPLLDDAQVSLSFAQKKRRRSQVPVVTARCLLSDHTSAVPIDKPKETLDTAANFPYNNGHLGSDEEEGHLSKIPRFENS